MHIHSEREREREREREKEREKDTNYNIIRPPGGIRVRGKNINKIDSAWAW